MAEITEIDPYSPRLLKKLIFLNESAKIKVDITEVEKAIYYAKKYHGDQKRDSGKPYYSHPLEIAYKVVDYCFKTNVIVSAILHDTIEDTDLTEEMIKVEFGELVASQVEALTRVKIDRKISSAEMIELAYHKKEQEVLLIKLCDRLHNIETIGAKSSEKRRKIAAETLEIFVVLSAHFETLKVEQELIKLCYQHLSVKPTLYLLQKEMGFSSEDSFPLLSLIFQNEVSQIYNL